MGLDMRLNNKYFVQNWDGMSDDKKHQITILRGGKPTTIPTDKIIYIETEIMCWRKANAIHKWFVETVQGGRDDCGTYYVGVDQLQELLDRVNRVIESTKLIPGKIKNGATGTPDGRWVDNIEDGMILDDPSLAQELLPTQEGFFFGNYDYDQLYWEKLLYTQTGLTELLDVDDNGRYYYHSSW